MERIKEIEKWLKLHDVESQFEEDAFNFLLKAFWVMRDLGLEFHQSYFLTRSYPVKPGPENFDRMFEERMAKECAGSGLSQCQEEGDCKIPWHYNQKPKND